jgi:hypothetical protein
MKEGNYLVNIRVLEASDLIPRSTSGYVNPFCVVTVMDKHETTKTSKKTLSPLWDHNCTFEFSNLTKSQLETATIKIEIFDRQYFVFTESVGMYEIDLSTVYYQRWHQYYMTWFTLVDPTDVKEGCMGYVKMNIDVLGPDDKPHINEKITEDSTSQTVVSDKIKQTGHLIIAELFKAEHLAPMNITKKSNDAFVKINYGGATCQSDKVESLNPTWNQILYVQAMLPNHSKNVQIELWNENLLMRDDLLGTCLIPFNSFNSMMDLPPMWVNIYGPPMCGTGKVAEDMAEHGFKRGSCYRGRILMRFSSMYQDNPKSRCVPMAFKSPEMIIPSPPTKAYFLRIEVYSGQELPGSAGMLHFQIGPYFKKTQRITPTNGVFDWGMCCVEFNRILLPIDPTQIPDLIVYFADEDFESHRKCFFRINAIKLLCKTKKRYVKDFRAPQLIKFKEDQTLDLVPDDQFSGFAIIRPVLFSFEPPERIDDVALNKSMKDYQLRLYFYVGRNLPTAEDGGTCNPLIVIRVASSVIFSTIKRSTINPEWYEVQTDNIKTYDHENKDAPPLAAVVMLYHVDGEITDPRELFAGEDDKANENIINAGASLMKNVKQIYSNLKVKKKVLLGRYWLDIDLSKEKKYKDPQGSDDIPMIYGRPKWVPIIYDKEQVVQGKILLSYCLIEASKAKKVPINPVIEPSWDQKRMTMFSIGIRNIKKVFADGGFPNYCSVEIRTSTRHFKLVDDQDVELNEEEIDKLSTFLKTGKFPKGNPEKALAYLKSDGDVNNSFTAIKGEQIGPSSEKIAKTTEENIDEKLGKLTSQNLLTTSKMKLQDNGLTFNRSFRLMLNVPSNKAVCPVMELFVYHYPYGQKKLFACGTFSMRETLAWFYGDEDDDEYKKRWDTFFKIGKGNRGEENKDKPIKLKVPKIKAENQLLFMDDLIYELPAGEQFISKKEQKKRHKEKENELKKLPPDPDMDEFGDGTAKDGMQGDDQSRMINFSPHLNKIANIQPETRDDDRKRKKWTKTIQEMDEGLDDQDLKELTEEEKIRICEDLQRHGYIDNIDEDEEEEEQAQPVLPHHISGQLQSSNTLGARGENRMKTVAGLHFIAAGPDQPSAGMKEMEKNSVHKSQELGESAPGAG